MPQELTPFPRKNNFDLIRLFAASQVVIFHSIEHLHLQVNSALMSVISAIPGVPIFFVISGFLISASYQQRRSLRQFFTNRAMRIFPALWACLVVSILSAWVLGGIGSGVNFKNFTVWIVAQSTIGQFYNPDFLRGYGVGTLNGSLWTIPVEIQFYILTPILLFMYFRIRSLFWAIFFIFLCLNVANSLQLIQSNLPGILGKLITVTFLPWIAIFIVGVLMQIHYIAIKEILEGKAFYWLAVYGAAIVLNSWVDLGINDNLIALPWSILLAFTACSCAFSWTNLSGVILGENDISYGVYIYHMPVVNMVLALAIQNKIIAAVIVLCTTFALAILS